MRSSKKIPPTKLITVKYRKNFGKELVTFCGTPQEVDAKFFESEKDNVKVLWVGFG